MDMCLLIIGDVNTGAEIRCLFSPTEVGVSFSTKVGKFIVLGGGGGGEEGRGATKAKPSLALLQRRG